MTGNRIVIGPGTMYGAISKMEKDGLIKFVCEENKRKTYEITVLGREIFEIEKSRIEILYKNIRKEI